MKPSSSLVGGGARVLYSVEVVHAVACGVKHVYVSCTPLAAILVMHSLPLFPFTRSAKASGACKTGSGTRRRDTTFVRLGITCKEVSPVGPDREHGPGGGGLAEFFRERIPPRRSLPPGWLFAHAHAYPS